MNATQQRPLTKTDANHEEAVEAMRKDGVKVYLWARSGQPWSERIAVDLADLPQEVVRDICEDTVRYDAEEGWNDFDGKTYYWLN